MFVLYWRNNSWITSQEASRSEITVITQTLLFADFLMPIQSYYSYFQRIDTVINISPYKSLGGLNHHHQSHQNWPLAHTYVLTLNTLTFNPGTTRWYTDFSNPSKFVICSYMIETSITDPTISLEILIKTIINTPKIWLGKFYKLIKLCCWPYKSTRIIVISVKKGKYELGITSSVTMLRWWFIYM